MSFINRALNEINYEKANEGEMALCIVLMVLANITLNVMD